jgi:hypothetical protein
MAKIFYYYDEKDKRKKAEIRRNPYKRYKTISCILLGLVILETIGIIVWGFCA